jgi:hypothetical protein
MRLFAPRSIQENAAPPLHIDDSPLLDFVDGSKAAEADIEIVQATVAYAGRLNGAVDIAHEADETV